MRFENGEYVWLLVAADFADLLGHRLSDSVTYCDPAKNPIHRRRRDYAVIVVQIDFTDDHGVYVKGTDNRVEHNVDFAKYSGFIPWNMIFGALHHPEDFSHFPAPERKKPGFNRE